MNIYVIYDKRRKEFFTNPYSKRCCFSTKSSAKSSLVNGHCQYSSLGDYTNEELSTKAIEAKSKSRLPYTPPFSEQSRYECREYVISEDDTSYKVI